MLSHEVSSSIIASPIQYDKEEKILYITFLKGGKYSYSEVPESIWTEMINNDSVGKFFLARIKGKYNTEKV